MERNDISLKNKQVAKYSFIWGALSFPFTLTLELLYFICYTLSLRLHAV